MEQDEAGRLRAFRTRFGRGWDLDAATATEEGEEKEGEMKADGEGREAEIQEEEDNLMDLISGSAGVAPAVYAKETPKGKAGSKKK